MSKNIYSDVRHNCNVVSGEEYREILCAISNVAAEMVQKTLGPYGATTMIEDTTFSYPTKDGWSALSRLRFADPLYNSIFNMIKQISFNIVNKVGDGTTTALIVANEFINSYLNNKELAKMRQHDVIAALERLKDDIILDIQSDYNLRKIDRNGEFDDIYDIAMISTNGNKMISKLIRKIYQETKNPNIYVSLQPIDTVEAEIIKGYRFDCNCLNHRVYVNEEGNICRLIDSSRVVAVFDHNVTYNDHMKIINGIIGYANEYHRDVVIMAPHFDTVLTDRVGAALDNLIKQGQVPNVMMIQLSTALEVHRDYMSDIVTLTGGQCFTYGKVRACNALIHAAEDMQIAMESADPTAEIAKINEWLAQENVYDFSSVGEMIEAFTGTIRSFVVGDNYAIIQDYDKVINMDEYESIKKELEEKHEELRKKANRNTSTIHKEYMQIHQRYIRFLGHMGSLNIGGGSELEKHCTKDAADDAVLACKSAYENGYVSGMSMTTLASISKLKNDLFYRSHELNKVVVEMLYHAYVETAAHVLHNRYPDQDRNNLTGKCEATNQSIVEYGILNRQVYNVVTEQFEKFDSTTIINSVSTDIEILKAVVSMLSLVLTSNQFLSVHRVFDKSYNLGERRVEFVENKRLEAEASAEGYMNALDRRGFGGFDLGTIINIGRSNSNGSTQGYTHT